MLLKNGSAPSSEVSPEANSAYTLVKSVVSQPYPDGLSDPTVFRFLMAQLLVDLSSDVKPNNFTPKWNFTTCDINWCQRIFKDVKVSKGNFTQAEPILVDIQPDTTSGCYGGNACQQFIANASDSIPAKTYRINFRQDASNIRQLLSFNQEANTFSNNTWDLVDSFTVTSTIFWRIDISSAIAKATETFSDYMRAHRPAFHIGTTYITETKLHVKWPWLALPALIVFCTLILLIAVIIVNRGTTLWKGSSLPLIFHPVEYDGVHNLGGHDMDPETIVRQADAMEVRMERRADGGLKFTMVDRDVKSR